MGKIKKQKQPVRVVSWEEYQVMVDKLAKTIHDTNKKLLFEFPQINVWGIPRGGSIVAISITHYDELFQYCYYDPIPLNRSKSSHDDSLIVVDDIVDSGDTAEEYAKRYQVASLFLRAGASFEPDWYVEKIEDNTWIKFPWEKDI